MGQSTHLFYKPQAGANMQQFLNGMYYALLEGRFLFDFVHEDRMESERLSKYSALILPNIAMLSDAQCDQLRAYVKVRRLAAGHIRNQLVRRRWQGER